MGVEGVVGAQQELFHVALEKFLQATELFLEGR
jgi:hypothetical protein